MGCIIVIGGGIVDGGSANASVPVAVPAGDEGHVAQVARVGHGVLLVLQDLVDDGRDLVGVLGRHTAVEHVGEVVAIDGTIVQVGHLLGGITTRFSWDLTRVAHKDDEGRRGTLVDTRVVKVLHVGLNGVVVTTSLCRSHHIHVEALLYLPVDPRLQGGDVVFGCNHDHVDGIGHQVGVVGVDVKDLTIVEHLLVDDVEIGAVGAEQHAFGFGAVGTVEADFNLDVVEHTKGVGGGVVADGVDEQRADADATHGALHFDCGFGSRGEAAGLIGIGVVHELNVFRILVLADRRLVRQDGADAIVGETIIGCRVTDDINARCGTKRHSQQLVRGRQFGRADFARGIGAFDGNFGESASFGSNLNALNGAIAEGGTELGELAVRDFSFCFVAQVNAAILCHGKHCAQGKNKK